MNESTPELGKVIQINEARIQDHRVVRSTVEETLNELLESITRVRITHRINQSCSVVRCGS